MSVCLFTYFLLKYKHLFTFLILSKTAQINLCNTLVFNARNIQKNGQNNSSTGKETIHLC